MTLKSEMSEMIAEACLLDADAVVDDAHLQDDLGADSLMLVELAEAISGKYSIALEADELVDVANVGELITLVEGRLSSR